MKRKKTRAARARTKRITKPGALAAPKTRTLTLRLPRDVADHFRRAAVLAGIPENSVFLAVFGLRLAALERSGDLPTGESAPPPAPAKP